MSMLIYFMLRYFDFHDGSFQTCFLRSGKNSLQVPKYQWSEYILEKQFNATN